MMDLTPIDIRRKKGDFGKGMRGYDTAEVDAFLEAVAERLEDMVREIATLRERVAQMSDALDGYRGREQAMNEALVTAQELREEIRTQSQREAELVVREAQASADETLESAKRDAERMLEEAKRDVERMVEEAKREVDAERDLLKKARRQRIRFLRSYRAFLENQLAEVGTEEAQSLPGDREAVEEEVASGR